MADDDASRCPPQAHATVSLAGVGTMTTNQVSPGTLQEILDRGDQSLIDQAFHQLAADDLTAYLESLPSPATYGGMAVGSQASRTPISSPSPRTRRVLLSQRILAAAGGWWRW